MLNRACGRLPHNPQAIARAPRLGARLPSRPAAPLVLDRSHLPFVPQLLGNDVLPICTCVAQVNAALGFAAAGGGFQFSAAQAAVNAAYSAVTGVPTGQIATSDGAIMLDVMRYMARTGIADASGETLLTGPFGSIDPADQELLAAACALIGPVELGVDLTLAEQQPGVWDIGRAGADQPWGGHACVLWDYTGLRPTDTVRIATWGYLQPATWRWVMAQLREAYAAAWPALLPPGGRTWSGLDIDGLRADVAAWRGAG